MERYVAYYRVSTKKQGESGLGLEAQVRMVQGYARNGSIVEEFTEKETGTSKRERPILAEAIEMCKETGAKLLIDKLDRLAEMLVEKEVLDGSEIDKIFNGESLDDKPEEIKAAKKNAQESKENKV